MCVDFIFQAFLFGLTVNVDLHTVNIYLPQDTHHSRICHEHVVTDLDDQVETIPVQQLVTLEKRDLLSMAIEKRTCLTYPYTSSAKSQLTFLFE